MNNPVYARSAIRALAVAATVLLAAALHAADYKPTHVNKAIELLAAGQPIYYDYGRGGYEEGKESAKTWADVLLFDFDGAALDFT